MYLYNPTAWTNLFAFIEMNDLIFKHKITLNGHLGSVFGLCPGPQKGFFSVGGDGYVVFWPNDNQENGELIARSQKALYCCHYLPSNNLLACGGLEGVLYFIDLNEKKIISAVQTGTSPIYSITSTPNHLITAHGDGRILFWHPEHLTLLNTLPLSTQAVRTLLLNDGQLYAGASDGFIYWIHPDDQKILHFFMAHEMSVFSLAIHNNQLYSGGRDARIKIWDVASSFQNLAEIIAHMGTVNSLCFSNDWLVSGGRDKLMRIWDLKGQLAESKNSFDKGHFHSVNKVISLQSTGELISCSDDKTIVIWEALPTAFALQ